jgi:hypothetical protein
MALVIRPAGFTGTLQTMTWTQGNNVSSTAYLWGGGGGGGGGRFSAWGIGGAGGGGQFTQVNFTVSQGDVLELAVGGPGQGGANQGYNAGGTPGSSYFDTGAGELFNLRDATPVSGPGGPVLPQWNPNYCTFLNVNGVWINPSTAGVFDKTYSVTFPVTGNYQFQASADNYATFYLDGQSFFTANDYRSTFEVGYPVTAGTHSIRVVGVNTGGPAAVALSITGGQGYGGGRGGNAYSYNDPFEYYWGGSAGGGGGGATVLIKNGSVIGVAGGGGGGGGSARRWWFGFGRRSGESAPGTAGQSNTPGQTAGQNGTNNSLSTVWYTGGAGGGGGGGVRGGNAGYIGSAGLAGYYGSGLGTLVVDPSGQAPGGTSNNYYSPGQGYGGSQNGGPGTGGYAMLTFDVSGIWVNQPGLGWKQTADVYAKADDSWSKVKGVWIKNDGVWEPVISSYAPSWIPISGRFGINPRAGAPYVGPVPPPEPIDGWPVGGFDGGGGGGFTN